MRLILLIIFGLILVSVGASLLGPLIALGIGAALVYHAYKCLVRPNKNAFSIIWWIIVGTAGISMIVGALPGFIFIGAVVATVYFFSKRNSEKEAPVKNAAKPDGSDMFKEYESFEAQWREVSQRG